MKRNFDTVIKDIDGKPFADGTVTLKTLVITSIQIEAAGDERMPVTEKVDLFKIASKVVGGGDVELSAEEIAIIKARIGKTLKPIFVGRAFELLEADLSV